jgi:hypothetical protein
LAFSDFWSFASQNFALSIMTKTKQMTKLASTSMLNDTIRVFGGQEEIRQNLWIITTKNYEFWLNNMEFGLVLIQKKGAQHNGGDELCKFCKKNDITVGWLDKGCLESCLGMEYGTAQGIAISKPATLLVASALKKVLCWLDILDPPATKRLEILVPPATKKLEILDPPATKKYKNKDKRPSKETSKRTALQDVSGIVLNEVQTRGHRTRSGKRW